VLLVDEVLSVGDYVFQRRSLEKMRAVLRSGTTVLFVSHNLRAVAELCPQSVLAGGGRRRRHRPHQPGHPRVHVEVRHRPPEPRRAARRTSRASC
jgi:ABC-type dipeptide/oligopeptide/nickel transport system ATPase subunit